MLVYDAATPAARAEAERLRPHLPVGYPVVAAGDLPAAGVLDLTPAEVRGSVVWVDADGTRHQGRAGVARALVACGGRAALRGHAAGLPVIGRLVLKGV